jgi:hypothetical protein
MAWVVLRLQMEEMASIYGLIWLRIGISEELLLTQ